MRAALLPCLVLALLVPLRPASAAAPVARADRLAVALAQIEAGRHGAARAALQALADDGSAAAETLLGAMHARGLGGRADPATAAAYWWRAAQRGHPPAQLALARALAAGAGVATNRAEAYRWAWVAATLGDAPVRREAEALTAQLRTVLSAAAAARAQAQAQAFRPWAPMDR